MIVDCKQDRVRTDQCTEWTFNIAALCVAKGDVLHLLDVMWQSRKISSVTWAQVYCLMHDIWDIQMLYILKHYLIFELRFSAKSIKSILF